MARKVRLNGVGSALNVIASAAWQSICQRALRLFYNLQNLKNETKKT